MAERQHRRTPLAGGRDALPPRGPAATFPRLNPPQPGSTPLPIKDLKQWIRDQIR